MAETVEFRVRKQMPWYWEIVILLVTVVVLLVAVLVLLVVGIPYSIYALVTKTEKKKFVAPPLDKVENAGEREFDLVIVGVTGYTGGWAAKHMAKTYGQMEKVKWAICGRNPKKLKAVIESLKADNPDIKDIPTIVADNMKMDDMESVAKRTRAVASFAGPFHRYGSNLVCACAKYGTHYSDSTGETNWVQQMISMYHDRAVESRARMVPLSGFDSIPADMSVYLAHKMLADKGDELESVDLACLMKGNLSGGTLETIASLIYPPKLVAPNMGFNPMKYWNGEEKKVKVSGGTKFLSKTATGQWAGINLFGDNNKKAVVRSAAYHGYADKWNYAETAVVGGWALTLSFSLMNVIFGALYALPPTQKVLRIFLPAPGEGPSEEFCKKGFYHFNVEATGKKGTKVYLASGARGEDPGYKGTSRMVVETALCLLDIEDDAPVGILTPACLGEKLATHLEKTGSYWIQSTSGKFTIQQRKKRAA